MLSIVSLSELGNDRDAGFGAHFGLKTRLLVPTNRGVDLDARIFEIIRKGNIYADLIFCHILELTTQRYSLMKSPERSLGDGEACGSV